MMKKLQFTVGKPSKLARLAMPVIAGIAMLAQSAAAQQGELRVICSNGIKAAVEMLLPDFERTSHQHVAIQYGPSAVLKRSIEGGAEFDLVILTPVVIDDLTKQGKLGASTVLATSNLAVGIHAGAPKTDISTPDAMKRRLLAAKTITYTKEGAANGAISDMIQRLGITGEITAKTVLQTVSGRAEDTVAEGENELVMAPLSEIVTVKGIEVLGLWPKEFQKPLVMSASVSVKAANPGAANALVRFLTSPAAVPAIKATGMEMAAHKK
jgi:molybdate transport system substrate-binding protein